MAILFILEKNITLKGFMIIQMYCQRFRFGIFFSEWAEKEKIGKFIFRRRKRSYVKKNRSIDGLIKEETSESDKKIKLKMMMEIFQEMNMKIKEIKSQSLILKNL